MLSQKPTRRGYISHRCTLLLFTLTVLATLLGCPRPKGPPLQFVMGASTSGEHDLSLMGGDIRIHLGGTGGRGYTKRRYEVALGLRVEYDRRLRDRLLFDTEVIAVDVDDMPMMRRILAGGHPAAPSTQVHEDGRFSDAMVYWVDFSDSLVERIDSEMARITV